MISPTNFHTVANPAHTPGPSQGTATDVSLPHIGWKSLSSPTFSSLPQSRTKAKSKRAGKKVTTSSTSNKNKPDHIPRPPNKFILFRKNFVANRSRVPNVSGKKCLSKQAGEAWHNLSSLEKRTWAKKAHVVATDHARKNPTWKFKPTRKSDKSDKSQAEPRHQSPPMVAAQPPPTAQPSVGATMPAALSPDNLPPSDLLRRRETFRLANWDDSVLSPHPRLAGYSNDKLDQLPDSLRRRSSSVPIPEAFYPSQGPASFPNQGQMFLENPFPPTNMQHRLSYSGIRPGFRPIDIFGPQENVSAERSAPDNIPLQPISSLRDGPPPSFEGYTIRVVSNPSASSAQQSISPLSRDTTSMTDLSRSSHFPHHAGFSPALISQNASEGLFPRTIPPALYVPNQMNSLRDGIPPRTIPLDPPMDSLQGNPNFSTVFPENSFRMESKAPVQELPSKPSYPQKEPFQFDISTDLFQHYYFHEPEGLQLNAFNGGHGAGTSDTKQLEPYFSESLDLNGDVFPDFSAFGEFVEMPYSAESSNPGSGAGSSPSNLSQIDFEAAFA